MKINNIKFKNILLFNLKLVVSLSIILFLLNNITIQDLFVIAREVNYLPVVLGGLLVAMQPLVASLRWKLIIRDLGESTPDYANLVRSFYTGLLFSQVLPSTVGGDVLRVWHARKWGHSLESAVMGVMLERILALVCLVIIFGLTLPYLHSKIQNQAFEWILPAIFGVSTFGILFLLSLDLWLKFLGRWRVFKSLSALSRVTKRLLTSPRVGWPMLGTSLVGYTLVFSGVYLMAVGIGIDISYLQVVAIMPSTVLVVLVPVSVAGWGVREGSMVFAFGLVGVPPEQGFILSVILGIWFIVTALPGAYFYLKRFNPAERGLGPQSDLLDPRGR